MRAAAWVVAALVLSFALRVEGSESNGSNSAGERAAADSLIGRSGEPPSNDDIAALARQTALDPWLVAERLRIRASPELAVRYVDALGAAGSEIRPYLQGLARTAHEPGIDAVLDAAESALASDDAQATAALGPALRKARGGINPQCVLGLLLRLLEGECLSADGGSLSATNAWISAATDAERVGWRSAAQAAYSLILHHAFPLGRLLAARRAAEHLYALQERARDVEGMAASLQDRGQIAERLGDSGEALRRMEQAIPLWQEVGALDRAVKARIKRLVMLANAGLVRPALQERAELAQLAQHQPGTLGHASLQLSWANVLWLFGDDAGGLAAVADAEAVIAPLGQERLLGFVHGTRGNVLTQAGRWQEALASHRSAFDLLTASGEVTSAAQSLNGMAMALWVGAREAAGALAAERDPAQQAQLNELRQARLKEGLEKGRAAVRDLTQAHADGARLAAEETLGRLLGLSGQQEAAVSLLERVEREAALLGQWRIEVAAAEQLAQIHADRRAWKEVLAEAGAGAAIFARVGASLASTDQDRALSYRATLFDLGVVASVESGDLPKAHEFLERGRATALLSALGGRAAVLRASIPKTLAEKLAHATSKKIDAIAAYHRAAVASDAGAAALWTAFLDGQRTESDVLEEVQRAEDRVSAFLAPASPTRLSDLQIRLGELQSTQRDGDGKSVPSVYVSFSLQADKGYAMVVTPTDTRVVTYDASATKAVRAALAQLVGRHLVSETRGLALAPVASPSADVLDRLRNLLLAPLKLGDGPLRLLVSPDREVAYVPFAMLVGPQVRVSFVPSATVLTVLLEQRLLKGTGVVGLGSPDYVAVRDPSVFVTRGGPRLDPLAGSEPEIIGITPSKDLDVRLLGPHATERALGAALSSRDVAGRASQRHRWRAVHFACHGLVDAEWPSLSALAVTPGDGEDGFLTAGEILRLQINADLVALSACQTGRGKFLRSEGIASLARAFMHQGAPRVLASLWSVPDDATAFLMQEFHKHWRTGRMGASEALRRAQDATRERVFEVRVPVPGSAARLEKRAHWAAPYYWAAWVIWGLPD